MVAIIARTTDTKVATVIGDAYQSSGALGIFGAPATSTLRHFAYIACRVAIPNSVIAIQTIDTIVVTSAFVAGIELRFTYITCWITIGIFVIAPQTGSALITVSDTYATGTYLLLAYIACRVSVSIGLVTP